MKASLPLLFPLLISTSLASPRIESNSITARHDLLLARDAGLIDSPVLTWPWPLGRSPLQERGEELTSFDAAYDRLATLYGQESQIGARPLNFTIAGASDHLPFRSYGYQPRDNFEASAAASWLGERIASKLQLTYALDPADGEEIRLDGSYLSVALGNWVVALDQVERWWGPGWDGSLLLSNNARPIPAVSLTRISPDAFETKWLKWLGPWTFNSFMGKLDNDEGERPGSNALLFGMRIDFLPFGWKNLNIGVNRAIQWAGDGRPSGLNTFWNALISEDNRVNNVTAENEPGNQLAGLDYRLKIPGWNLAQYGQITGEDEDDYQPDANMILYGLETWGELESINATWRAYYEFSDTNAQYLLAEPRQNTFNIAYNHGIYSSGYRDKGRVIGHAMDGDGRMKTFGGFIAQANGNLWGAKLRSYELNRDGAGPNSVTIVPINGHSLELFAELRSIAPRWQFWKSDPISNQQSAISNFKINVGISVYDEENKLTGEEDSGMGGYLAVSREL